jgi:DNA-binding NarL/FixJ family response regulator
MTVSGDGVRVSRILLVEDHSSFREALAHTLEKKSELSVAAQAGSLAEGREVLDGIDIAVVDLALPDGDGVELIRELHARNPRCLVLVLSASVDPAQHARAVEAGAAGVINKAASLAKIIDAVQSLAKGETPFSQENNELLRFASRHRERDRKAQRTLDLLTPREREVLQALSEGLENAEIAQRLNMTISTQRTHMVHIFDKLGARSRLQALVLAVRCGAIDIR